MDRTLAIWLYNQGYQAGHHDTVEGMFTDVMPVDMDSYHDDVVADLLSELDQTIQERPKGQCSPELGEVLSDAISAPERPDHE